jgi:D-alanyl-D-alanine carboxypeptidase
MSNLADSSAVGLDMHFAICSIGKNYVAALTLQLVDEGKIGLEDTVGRWLPPYHNVHPAITI